MNMKPMDTIQIRVTPKVKRTMDRVVRKGFYHSRSDLIRDAIRKLLKAKGFDDHA